MGKQNSLVGKSIPPMSGKRGNEGETVSPKFIYLKQVEEMEGNFVFTTSFNGTLQTYKAVSA